jgi:predicted metalloprotease with PDZ domain
MQQRSLTPQSLSSPQYRFIRRPVTADRSRGLGIGLDSNMTIVEFARPAGPAEIAGVQLDDQLVEINGEPLKGRSPAELMPQDPHAPLVLGLRRPIMTSAPP